MICQECHRNKAEVGTDTCFRCRVATINFGWRGGGYVYGRSNFSARTNEEFVNEHVGAVRDNPNIERADPL